MSVTAKKHKPQKNTHRENAYTPKKNALWKIFGSEFSGTTTNFDHKPQCLRLENAPFTYDAASDVYFYGYRYYSTKLGRWISRDPIREHGGMNVYGFVGNNSIGYVDFDMGKGYGRCVGGYCGGPLGNAPPAEHCLPASTCSADEEGLIRNNPPYPGVPYYVKCECGKKKRCVGRKKCIRVEFKDHGVVQCTRFIWVDATYCGLCK